MANWRIGGMPYKPDVEKLKSRFGIPDRGTLIEHELIASVIGLAWRSERYKGVLNSWRRMLKALPRRASA